MADKTITSVDNAFVIIEMIIEEGGVTPKQLQAEFDFSKANVHYYLKTLKRHGLIAQENGEYHLSFGFVRYGGITVEETGLVGQLDETVHKLSEETGKLALLAVDHQDMSIYIHQAKPQGGIQGYFIGKTRKLHTTAFGKAILAFLPEQRRRVMIDEEYLKQHTARTVVSEEELRDELELVRENEFAYSDGEFNDSLRSLAAPIWSKNRETLLGSIGIIGDATRIEDPYARTKAQRFEKTDRNIVKRLAKTAQNKLADLEEQ
jgi:DNA-binding IclR family transcriptional regulator